MKATRHLIWLSLAAAMAMLVSVLVSVHNLAWLLQVFGIIPVIVYQTCLSYSGQDFREWHGYFSCAASCNPVVHQYVR